MNNLNIIDSFTATFTAFIDSGFGLLQPDVNFLISVLVAIDIALAGLFWALGDEGFPVAGFLRKVLYIGAFALIIDNFQMLSQILFDSMAGIGLKASGTTLTATDLMRPGFIAGVGFDAAEPLIEAVGGLLGPIAFFENFPTIAVLMLAWAITLVAFFLISVQLFITIIEFKLTTLAGFLLVPFALWNKTSFLAERVLGHVIGSGIKMMVLAVITGIGASIFATLPVVGPDVTLRDAAAIILASLALLGLGLFGPGVAAGLASGAPQLGAGAAAATVGLTAAGTTAAGAAAARGAQLAGTGGGAALRAGATLSGGAGSAYSLARAASGASGAAGVAAGVAGVARAAGGAVGDSAGGALRTQGQGLAARHAQGARAAFIASGGGIVSPGGSGGGGGDSGGSDSGFAAGGSGGRSGGSSGGAPDWARRLQAGDRAQNAALFAMHALRQGDRAVSPGAPSLGR